MLWKRYMGIVINVTKTLEQRMIEDYEREVGECKGVLRKKCTNDERMRYIARLSVIESAIKSLKKPISLSTYKFGGYSRDEIERFEEANERYKNSTKRKE